MFANLIFSGQTVPAVELAGRAARAAAGFYALGVREGDVLAVMTHNEPVFLEMLYAARALGAYVCPINWHFKADEAGYLLRDCGAKALVVNSHLVPQIASAIPNGLACIAARPAAATRVAFALAETQCGVPQGWLDWERWRDSYAQHSGEPMRPRGIVAYTSGTTGRPKGVRRLAPPAESVATYAAGLAALYHTVFDLDAASRAFIAAPLYHSAPASYILNASQVGATLIIEPRFDAEHTLALIEREHISHAYLVPAMYQRLLRLPEAVRARYDLSSMRFVASTGSPCPSEVKRAMIDWWGPVINECYASSEIGYTTFISASESLARPGCAGRPIAPAQLRILDDDGLAIPAGEVGTIYARQPAIADFTYIGNDAARAGMERDGLFTVGDMGYLDAEGYLYVSDRKADMVISGGVNIYPAEIEAVLAGMPGVADCAVFGIPNEEFGEALAAAVQCREGALVEADDVKRFLGERIAGYKVPRVVTFHASLPREETGKIFKRLLREPYWRDVGRRI